jgi:hypothetical protein
VRRQPASARKCIKCPRCQQGGRLEFSEPKRAWELLHHYAHGRLAFTTRRLAKDARVDFTVAEKICDKADDWGWIYRPQAEVADEQGSMWVGRLQ